MQVRAQVDEQQPVLSLVLEKAQDECFIREHRAVYAMLSLRAKRGFGAAQFQ